ncbi:helix-turn-helix transcriptional regulator [Aliisedimentitalea sp. MJ-SS2]|uniref:helix-turn-helix domain-containing protein n=1 Tax=Aliisedimentitalea sp. MJ-SS2 TaxID=3049795 RepID=UPI00292F0CF1|nr:helix-turn-helix transcriptional regulator [Alisedimentitalea sp. MJ-SS2]
MRLEEYLARQQMSLRALARASGLGVATVKRVRDGTCIASRKTLNAIVDATDGAVTIAELISVALEAGSEDHD